MLVSSNQRLTSLFTKVHDNSFTPILLNVGDMIITGKNEDAISDLTWLPTEQKIDCNGWESPQKPNSLSKIGWEANLLYNH